MPFLAGRGVWPSALSRARSLRLSERSGRPLTGGAGGPGAGFQQEGQDRTKDSSVGNSAIEVEVLQIPGQKWGWSLQEGISFSTVEDLCIRQCYRCPATQSSEYSICMTV